MQTNSASTQTRLTSAAKPSAPGFGRSGLSTHATISGAELLTKKVYCKA